MCEELNQRLVDHYRHTYFEKVLNINGIFEKSLMTSSHHFNWTPKSHDVRTVKHSRAGIYCMQGARGPPKKAAYIHVSYQSGEQCCIYSCSASCDNDAWLAAA